VTERRTEQRPKFLDMSHLKIRCQAFASGINHIANKTNFDWSAREISKLSLRMTQKSSFFSYIKSSLYQISRQLWSGRFFPHMGYVTSRSHFIQPFRNAWFSIIVTAMVIRPQSHNLRRVGRSLVKYFYFLVEIKHVWV